MPKLLALNKGIGERKGILFFRNANKKYHGKHRIHEKQNAIIL